MGEKTLLKERETSQSKIEGSNIERGDKQRQHKQMVSFIWGVHYCKYTNIILC